MTVQSQIYNKKIEALSKQIDLHALATPLLAPIIEEGFYEHKLVEDALNEYLSNPSLQNIDAIVLGCTHYPIIKKAIADFYKNNVDIIDAAKIVADAVKTELSSRDLLSSGQPDYHFYVSDYTENFAKGTRLFFGEEIKVEPVDIF
jgi:glutamate racemase